MQVPQVNECLSSQVAFIKDSYNSLYFHCGMLADRKVRKEEQIGNSRVKSRE
jgi:hypothetical protein